MAMMIRANRHDKIPSRRNAALKTVTLRYTYWYLKRAPLNPALSAKMPTSSTSFVGCWK
jgi:hypothetical protein